MIENLITPCEIASKAVVPTIRALVAKELSEFYKMKQEDIAHLLGITQSAVSQYLRNIRGRALDIENVIEVKMIVKNLAFNLQTNSNSRSICLEYCEACKIIRSKKILCIVHKRLDPSINERDCDICLPLNFCIKE